MREAKRTAMKLIAKEKVRKEAKAESAKLLANARQKAAQILWEAKQAAVELARRDNAKTKLK